MLLIARAKRGLPKRVYVLIFIKLTKVCTDCTFSMLVTPLESTVALDHDSTIPSDIKRVAYNWIRNINQSLLFKSASIIEAKTKIAISLLIINF